MTLRRKGRRQEAFDDDAHWLDEHKHLSEDADTLTLLQMWYSSGKGLQGGSKQQAQEADAARLRGGEEGHSPRYMEKGAGALNEDPWTTFSLGDSAVHTKKESTKMPSGSCLCGRLKYSFTGEPAAVGSPKHFVRKGDSGGNVTYSFCGECPSLLYVDVEASPGVKIIKMGSLDVESERAFLDKAKPGVEIYTKNRFAWCTAVADAEHAAAAPA
ncbi:hypothetical protein FH972_026124 [Carpinus fangiana]|uniref:CENP-V/GFA domain-containing protein n=1 Tax=Carpinus fangiana TaxID=176857 RepID=A0A5N6L3E4_9ROSI|nr:hypothetical protein FH972_026124 [Carpinus fangiana]